MLWFIEAQNFQMLLKRVSFGNSGKWFSVEFSRKLLKLDLKVVASNQNASNFCNFHFLCIAIFKHQSSKLRKWYSTTCPTTCAKSDTSVSLLIIPANICNCRRSHYKFMWFTLRNLCVFKFIYFAFIQLRKYENKKKRFGELLHLHCGANFHEKVIYHVASLYVKFL